MLGHAKLDTTALYAQVATNVIRAVMSPLDRLTLLNAPGRAARLGTRLAGPSTLEVADISATTGRRGVGNAGHVSLDQLKVMSAIERCRTAALGGHVALPSLRLHDYCL